MTPVMADRVAARNTPAKNRRDLVADGGCCIGSCTSPLLLVQVGGQAPPGASIAAAGAPLSCLAAPGGLGLVLELEPDVVSQVLGAVAIDLAELATSRAPLRRAGSA